MFVFVRPIICAHHVGHLFSLSSTLVSTKKSISRVRFLDCNATYRSRDRTKTLTETEPSKVDR